MPLLGTKVFSPQRLAAKDVADEKDVFVISLTGERFTSEADYLRKLSHYAERVWTCLSTGRTNLTFEEAMASERECKKTLAEKFHHYYEKPILEMLCHSTDGMEKLVDKCFARLRSQFFPGEPVSLRHKSSGKNIKGTIVKLDMTPKEGTPTSDKAVNTDLASDEHKYSVMVGNMAVNGVPASDLVRENKLPSKDLIKMFIRTYAVRNNLSKEWRLISDEKAVEHGIRVGSHHVDVNQLLQRQHQQCSSSMIDIEALEGSQPTAKADTVSKADISKLTKGGVAERRGSVSNGANGVNHDKKGTANKSELAAALSTSLEPRSTGSKVIGKGASEKNVPATACKIKHDANIKAKPTMDSYVVAKSKNTSDRAKASSSAASQGAAATCVTPSQAQLLGRSHTIPVDTSPGQMHSGMHDNVAEDDYIEHVSPQGRGISQVPAEQPVICSTAHGTSSRPVVVWDSDDDVTLSQVKKQVSPGKKNGHSTAFEGPSQATDGRVCQPECDSSSAKAIKQLDSKKATVKSKQRVQVPQSVQRESSDDDDVALIVYKNAASSEAGQDKDVRKKGGLKQATLFDLSRKAGELRVVLPITTQQSTVPEVVQKYEKAAAENDIKRMQKLATQAAAELSAQQREHLPDKMKAAVHEKHELLELRRKMKFASADEKATLQKQMNTLKVEKAAAKRRLLLMRCEDTDLDLKPLPAPRPLDCLGSTLTFADVLCITEFIHCYRGLLAPGSLLDDAEISADTLIQLLNKVEAGDAQSGLLLGEIMTMLLQILVNDEQLQDFSVLGVRLHDIPVNSYTASEIARLFFSSWLRPKTACPTGVTPVDTDDVASITHDAALSRGCISDDLLTRLGCCELGALSPEENLMILAALCDQVLCSRSAESFVADQFSKLSTALKQVKQCNTKKGAEESCDHSKTSANQPIEAAGPTKSHGSSALGPDHSSILAVNPAEEEPRDRAGSDTGDSGLMRIDVLRRRREQAAKSAREREIKAQQERIQREQEAEVRRLTKQQEAVKKQYTELLKTTREALRCRPLGTDRYHNRYWRFYSSRHSIYVEQGWAGAEMNYCVQHELAQNEPGKSEVTAQTGAAPSSTSENNSAPSSQLLCAGDLNNVEKTFPQPAKNQWLVYDSLEGIDALLAALHPNGFREHDLAQNLKEFQADLTRSMKTAKTPSCDAGRTEEYVGAFQRFQEELEELELRLQSGDLGGVSCFESWSGTVHSATTISELGSCLVECGDAVLPKFLRGTADLDGRDLGQSSTALLAQSPEPVHEKSSGPDTSDEQESCLSQREPAKFSISRWKEAVAGAATLSRLHVLLGILEVCIRWEKSAKDAKCKVCRKKKGDEECLLLCDDCNMAFHLHCLRPMLFEVPEGDWFCPACKPLPPKRESRPERVTTALLGSRDQSLASDSDNKYSDESKAFPEDSSDDNDEGDAVSNKCCICSEGGRSLLHCNVCSAAYHLRCHNPPLRCAPVSSSWACSGCRVSGDAARKKGAAREGRLRGRRLTEASDQDCEPEPKGKDSETSEEDERAVIARRRRTRQGLQFTAPAGSQKIKKSKERVTNKDRSIGKQGQISAADLRVAAANDKVAGPRASRKLGKLSETTSPLGEELSDSDDLPAKRSMSVQQGLRQPASAAAVAASERLRSRCVEDRQHSSSDGGRQSRKGRSNQPDRNRTDQAVSRKAVVRSGHNHKRYWGLGEQSVTASDDSTGEDSSWDGDAVASRKATGGNRTSGSVSRKTLASDCSDDDDDVPRKKRPRSLHAEPVSAQSSSRSQRAQRQSKTVAADAIRNGYMSSSSGNDGSSSSDNEESSRPPARRVGTRQRRLPSTDDDMPHLVSCVDNDSHSIKANCNSTRKRLADEDVHGPGKRSSRVPSSSIPGMASSTASGHSSDSLKACSTILQKLLKHPSSGNFEEPVDPNEVPDYYEIIKEPLTLANIREKVSNGCYASTDDFAADMTLMFRNAFEYNKAESDVATEARLLEEEFVKLIGQHLPSQAYEPQYRLYLRQRTKQRRL